MEITPTRHVTIGRWTVPVPWLAALAVLALTAALLSVVAPPSSADHGNTDAGHCGPHGVTYANDSTDVKTPLGDPGLAVRFRIHCNAGGPTYQVFDPYIEVDGKKQALVRMVFDFQGGGERRQATEVHLPVQAVSEVCVGFESNGTRRCVSSSEVPPLP